MFVFGANINHRVASASFACKGQQGLEQQVLDAEQEGPVPEPMCCMWSCRMLGVEHGQLYNVTYLVLRCSV